MSMRDYPIQGYGIERDDIKWDYYKIGKLFNEDNLLAIKDAFRFNDSDVYDAMLGDNIQWLGYAFTDEKCYFIIWDLHPWQVTEKMPKSTMEARQKMWDTLSPYIDEDFDYEDFCRACGDISETYYG